MNAISSNKTFMDKIGIPSNLTWGYIGIIVFMIGDGLEQGWLSPYLVENGLTLEHTAFYLPFMELLYLLLLGFQGICTNVGTKKSNDIWISIIHFRFNWFHRYRH